MDTLWLPLAYALVQTTLVALWLGVVGWVLYAVGTWCLESMMYGPGYREYRKAKRRQARQAGQS